MILLSGMKKYSERSVEFILTAGGSISPPSHFLGVREGGGYSFLSMMKKDIVFRYISSLLHIDCIHYSVTVPILSVNSYDCAFITGWQASQHSVVLHFVSRARDSIRQLCGKNVSSHMYRECYSPIRTVPCNIKFHLYVSHRPR